jgi:copper(I)-binding protein
MTRLAVAIVMGPGLALSAQAQTSGSTSIAVEHAWARATPNGAKTGAVYMTLLNKGSADDRLLGASTPVAKKVQFHSGKVENGMMKMQQLSSIPIRPGMAIALKPGATHAMLIGLRRALKQSQVFPLTLEFERAGEISVIVSVGSIGAMGPSGMGGMEMK